MSEITHVTPEQFIAEQYSNKVIKECMVYTSHNTASVYKVEFNENKKQYVARHALFSTWLNDGDLLRVEWDEKPQADAKPDSGATGAKNTQVEALLPQTIHTVRYGTPEFEQLERDDCEREVSRLQAELASAKAEAGRLRAALADTRNNLIELAYNGDDDPSTTISGIVESLDVETAKIAAALQADLKAGGG